jgi:hypothetical protein
VSSMLSWPRVLRRDRGSRLLSKGKATPSFEVSSLT